MTQALNKARRTKKSEMERLGIKTGKSFRRIEKKMRATRPQYKKVITDGVETQVLIQTRRLRID